MFTIKSMNLCAAALLWITFVQADYQRKDDDVIFPSKKDLVKALKEGGFGDFAEKTRIVDTLLKTPHNPLGVVMAVELALADFISDYGSKRRIIEAQMAISKPILFKIILQADPKSLAELEEQGLIPSLKEDEKSDKKFTSKRSKK